MIIPKLAIPRRTVLRGLGATLALPLLERMVPTTALARAATTAVARFCTVYVPNGIVMERWTPETEGTGFAFTPTLKPLEPYREHLLLLSGLDNTGARSRSGASGAHAKPAGAFMTGIEPLPTTGSSSLSLGISMDQIIANTLGQETPLPSLELGLEGADTVNGVGTCDVGFSCAYQNRLAWETTETMMRFAMMPWQGFTSKAGFGSICAPAGVQSKALETVEETTASIPIVTSSCCPLDTGLSARERILCKWPA